MLTIPSESSSEDWGRRPCFPYFMKSVVAQGFR